MNKETWRQFGYLEGLRKMRNWARTQAKSAKKIMEEVNTEYQAAHCFGGSGSSYEQLYQQEKGSFDQAVRMKIQMEKFYTAERERLFEKNITLKNVYPYAIKNNNANVGTL